MDKEDCIQVLLSTLQKPQWKRGNSVTDWDLKDILWRSGILLSPDQVSALLADMKRRGLIAARERREGSRLVELWGVRVTPAGEEWLSHRATNRPVATASPQLAEETPTEETSTSSEAADGAGPALDEPFEASLPYGKLDMR